jgi:hypothetical protein
MILKSRQATAATVGTLTDGEGPVYLSKCDDTEGRSAIIRSNSPTVTHLVPLPLIKVAVQAFTQPLCEFASMVYDYLMNVVTENLSDLEAVQKWLVLIVFALVGFCSMLAWLNAVRIMLDIFLYDICMYTMFEDEL